MSTALLEAPSVHDRPSLGDVARRASLSLLIACAIPAGVFYATFRLFGVWPAIFAALAWSYGAIAFRALTGRRVMGLLLLSATVMTARTLVSLMTGSTFLYFLQPILTDAAIGSLFLLSVAAGRPVVARVAGDFYPMCDELAQRPRIRRLFRRLTVMWGLLALGKATAMLWLLLSQSLETFVLVKSVSILTVNASAIAATIGLAVLAGSKEGLLSPRTSPATAVL